MEGVDEASPKTLSAYMVNHDCPECGKAFPSKRSVAMHRHHQHPAELNWGRLATLPTRNLVWSADKDEALLRHVDNIWREHMLMKIHLEQLQLQFPFQSTEALKKCLKHLGWTPAP